MCVNSPAEWNSLWGLAKYDYLNESESQLLQGKTQKVDRKKKKLNM